MSRQNALHYTLSGLRRAPMNAPSPVREMGSTLTRFRHSFLSLNHLTPARGNIPSDSARGQRAECYFARWLTEAGRLHPA
jgi:hypothetical protein